MDEVSFLASASTSPGERMRLENASSEAKLADQRQSDREQQHSEQGHQGNEQQDGTGMDRGPVDEEGGPPRSPGL